MSTSPASSFSLCFVHIFFSTISVPFSATMVILSSVRHHHLVLPQSSPMFSLLSARPAQSRTVERLACVPPAFSPGFHVFSATPIPNSGRVTRLVSHWPDALHCISLFTVVRFPFLVSVLVLFSSIPLSPLFLLVFLSILL